MQIGNTSVPQVEWSIHTLGATQTQQSQIEWSIHTLGAMQTDNTTTPEGWAKLDHADSGEAPNMMDEGELPVDANGEYVSGVPVDPDDPRTANMKPAGKTSPPARNTVSMQALPVQASVYDAGHKIYTLLHAYKHAATSVRLPACSCLSCSSWHLYLDAEHAHVRRLAAT